MLRCLKAMSEWYKEPHENKKINKGLMVKFMLKKKEKDPINILYMIKRYIQCVLGVNQFILYINRL